jgi:hypothetical protein
VVKVVQPAYGRVFRDGEGAAELAKALWKETVAALKEAEVATLPIWRALTGTSGQKSSSKTSIRPLLSKARS